MRAGISAEEAADVLDRLRRLAFLGVEIRDGEFAFSEGLQAIKIDDSLATELESRSGRTARLRVNPAYHAHLSIATGG